VLLVCYERTHYHPVSWTCFFFEISYHVSLLVSEFICLKSPNFSTASTRMVCIEAGNSNPYLVFDFIQSILCVGSINEAGFSEWTEYFFFHCTSARCFIILPFLIKLNRWVSLKARDFTYSKFHQIINSTSHHILDLGGSSIP
jgi:hypothetical protein